MTTSLILAALTVVSRPPEPETVLPLRPFAGLWTVRARLKDREGYFVLATERLNSIASVGFLEGRSGEKAGQDPALDLGATRFASIPEGPMDKEGVVGALGADFFQGKRVAFDLDRRTVSVTEGPGTTPKGAREISAHRSFEGVLGIDVPLGGKPTRMVLASGSYRTGLFSTAAGGFDAMDAFSASVFNGSTGRSQRVPVRLGRAPASSPLPGPWMLVESLPDESAEPYPSEPSGLLALADLGAARITLDFAREVLVLDGEGKEGREARFLSQATGLPLRADGDAVRIGDAAIPVPPMLRRYAGLEVESFDGVNARAFLKALRGKSDADRALVVAGAAWRGSTPRTFRLKREDKTIELTIDADGRLTAKEPEAG